MGKNDAEAEKDLENTENINIESEDESSSPPESAKTTDSKQHKIRASRVEVERLSEHSSSRVLSDEEADEILKLAFGEQEESNLDQALKESLGLVEEDETFYDVENKKEKSTASKFLSFLLTLAICVIIAYLLTRFVIQRNTVMGSSMYPTLQEEDELFVEKISHYWNDYQRGELITAQTSARTENGKPMVVIKRIIGLPGETIDIKDGKVFIDGKELDEPYLADDVETTKILPGPVHLDEDEYFLMGDNRKDSFDSRNFGPVKEENLIGRVLIRFYPFDKFGKP